MLYAHTHPFNGPLSGTTQVSRYRKGKTNLDFTEARGSGISWAICKSASRSRQMTMPAPHRSVFYRPDALPAAQPQRQSTEGKCSTCTFVLNYCMWRCIALVFIHIFAVPFWTDSRAVTHCILTYWTCAGHFDILYCLFLIIVTLL